MKNNNHSNGRYLYQNLDFPRGDFELDSLKPDIVCQIEKLRTVVDSEFHEEYVQLYQKEYKQMTQEERQRFRELEALVHDVDPQRSAIYGEAAMLDFVDRTQLQKDTYNEVREEIENCAVPLS